MNSLSSPPLTVVRTVADLRRTVAAWRANGHTVGFVPTMGALHEGHLSLVRLAQSRAGKVVVSIFVNPKQFGANEDFDRYPRVEDADAEKLASVNADLLFAPSAAEMYPQGFATTVSVAGVTEGLCGGSRPGHFDGVATVVAKLLLQCLPDVAVFGDKDYQQLLTIKRLACDLDIPVEIIGGPTLREADGLALSSRNTYLTPSQRRTAAAIPAILRQIATSLESGVTDVDKLLSEGRTKLLKAGFEGIDYLELRDAETLMPVTAVSRPARVLVATRLGAIRLIDNMAVLPPGYVARS